MSRFATTTSPISGEPAATAAITMEDNLSQLVGCMPPMNVFELLGLNLQELTELVQGTKQPLYRARQLCTALYRQRISSLDQATTLPLSFRHELQEKGWIVGLPAADRKFVAQDGTIRYLFRFSDGESVETVWMPEGDDGEQGDGTEAGEEEHQGRRRATICVSSQAGCAVNCQFCMTALLGVRRNLTPGEIVGQVLAVLNDHRVDIEKERINLVFMGQGEPFLNYENFMKAVQLLVNGAGIAESRMTVSTAGIVSRIRDFGKEPLRPKLAISLNAPNDALRNRLMPINRKWNLEALLAAARDFPLRNRERLTFEYVLLDGVNDHPEHARELVQLLGGLTAKVNLIALNPGPEIPFGTPAADRVLAFQKIVMAEDIPTFIRRPRGREIYAACGQLKSSAVA